MLTLAHFFMARVVLHTRGPYAPPKSATETNCKNMVQLNVIT